LYTIGYCNGETTSVVNVSFGRPHLALFHVGLGRMRRRDAACLCILAQDGAGGGMSREAKNGLGLYV